MKRSRRSVLGSAVAFVAGYGSVASDPVEAAPSLEVGGQQCRVIAVRGSDVLVEPGTLLNMYGFEDMVNPEPGDFVLMAHPDRGDADALVAIPMLRWFRFTASPVDLGEMAYLPLGRPIAIATRTKLLGLLRQEREAGVATQQLLRVAVHARDEDGQVQRAVFISNVVVE